MEWWNLWVPFIGTLAGIYVNYRISKKNSEESKVFQDNQRTFQKEMTQKQIDANLKAKARIEWIQEVRKLVSEYLVVIHKVGELLFLLKENNIQKEQSIRKNQNALGKDSREISESNEQYAIETDLNEKERKKVLSELENQKYKSLAISEQLVLYFSNQKEHEKIKRSLSNIRKEIIDIYNKAYGPGINETYYDEESSVLNKNSKELSEEIGKYLKIEWDKAKEGK